MLVSSKGAKTIRNYIKWVNDKINRLFLFIYTQQDLKIYISVTIGHVGIIDPLELTITSSRSCNPVHTFLILRINHGDESVIKHLTRCW